MIKDKGLKYQFTSATPCSFFLIYFKRYDLTFRYTLLSNCSIYLNAAKLQVLLFPFIDVTFIFSVKLSLNDIESRWQPKLHHIIYIYYEIAKIFSVIMLELIIHLWCTINCSPSLLNCTLFTNYLLWFKLFPSSFTYYMYFQSIRPTCT